MILWGNIVAEEFELHQEGEGAVIALPAVLDLAAADKLWAVCAEAFEKNLDLTLDGTDVERLTTGCAQVMLSTWKSMEKGGMTFRVKGCSNPMRSGLEDLGLTEILEKWSVE